MVSWEWKFTKLFLILIQSIERPVRTSGRFLL
jgi:hypothetical protein